MKKKTERKPKKENKERSRNWCAFDEPLWGPTKLNALLDELYEKVQEGEMLSLAEFRQEKKISLTFWYDLIRKNPFFKHGISVIKDAIYSQRIKCAMEDPESESMLMRGLNFYDQDTIMHKQEQAQFEQELFVERTKDIATHQNSLAKDLATHNSNLKKGENNEWHEMLIKNVMLDSEGNAFLKFGGPRLTEEQCPTTVSPISTTSDQIGTNNES